MEDLQNDEFYLKGDLGTANGRDITKLIKDNKSITITIGEVVKLYLDKNNNIEDAEFEIINPESKQIENNPTQ